MANPFTISFGRQPLQFISRPVETNEIIDTFEQDPPSNQVFMLTGVRGSGKTVMMTEIAKAFSRREDWIVVELSPERDMLTALAAKLCSRPELFALFVEAKLNFSLLGFGVEVKNTAPISDIESALSRMLGVIRTAGKKLLVTVDEAVNNANVRVFASSFQKYSAIFLAKTLAFSSLLCYAESIEGELIAILGLALGGASYAVDAWYCRRNGRYWLDDEPQQSEP